MFFSVYLCAPIVHIFRMRRTGLAFLLFTASVPLYAEKMFVSDGSGNSYRIGHVLFYDPVTPEKSSSGMYSGGVGAAVLLTDADRAELKKLFGRAFAAKADLTDKRAKGTIQIQDNAGRRAILKQASPSGNALETFLKACLGRKENQIPREYAVHRSDNPWKGMTGTSEEEERNRTIQAVPKPNEGYEPLTDPVFSFSRRPLFFRSLKDRQIVVDADAFETIHRPDATKTAAGPEIMVTRARKPELLSPVFLLPLFLTGQSAVTYWHTDANIRFTGEEERADRICYLFEGEHHYYTNEKNTGLLRFAICTEAKTGRVFLAGRE